jgi:hypothetical protein
MKLAMALAGLLGSATAQYPRVCPVSDIDGDRTVDTEDILTVLSQFGMTCLTCQEQNDRAVAYQYCSTRPALNIAAVPGVAAQTIPAGHPMGATMGICQAATDDTAAMLAMCNILGVNATAITVCRDVGYSVSICNQVAERVWSAYGNNCATLAATAQRMVCPSVLSLTDETTCTSWSDNNAADLGLGSSSLTALTPHVANAITEEQFSTAKPPRTAGRRRSNPPTPCAPRSRQQP